MSGWIGVDLDGTLAEYGGWMGPGHIGAPIPKMVARVKKWLAEGQEVRIMTARVWPYTGVLRPENAMPVPDGLAGQSALEAACAIGDWCREHIGQLLPITCVKDYAMIELWDDRAVQVAVNTGERVDGGT